jgi:hypothetical protein
VGKYFLVLLVMIFLYGCANRNTTSNGKAGDETDSAVINMNDLSATKSIYNLLCQDWDYKEDAESVDSSNGSEELDVPYRSLCFFADSTIVKNPRGDVQFGKWEFNDADKIISIKYGNGKTEKYKIMQVGAKDMTLIKTGEDNKSIILIADAKQEKNYADDPFYYSNNIWRIKPKQPETDDAIKERLKKCIAFYITFFKDNLKRDENKISFYGLPSCFTWYQGGIYIKDEERLDANWVNSFYNHEQAMKAHKIMVDLITKKYDWDKEEKNWVKQSTPVLQQMLDSLK